MATGDNYGFFWDSNNGDRTYNASSFESWLKKFFTSGVFANDLIVSAGSGMNVSVAAGYANVDGKVRMFDAQNVAIATAGTSYPRIDTVVVERNDSNRNITLKAVTGAYNGNSPVPTAPVRSGGVYQLVLAEVLVPAGASSITASNIADKRMDSSVCGVVTGAVEQLDFDTLLAQFTEWQEEQQSAFNTWFNRMKGQLTTDAAGNLQAQIDSLNYQLGDVILSSKKFILMGSAVDTKTINVRIFLDKPLANDINPGDININTMKIMFMRGGNYYYQDVSFTPLYSWVIGEQIDDSRRCLALRVTRSDGNDMFSTIASYPLVGYVGCEIVFLRT